MSKLTLSKQENSFDTILEEYSRFVNNNKEVIPKIFAYVANYKTDFKDSEHVAAGFSFNKKIALIRVLGEAVERYCLDAYKPKPVYIDSIKNIHSSYLNPLSFAVFSRNQFKKASFRKFKIDKDTKFNWIKGISLTNNTPILVPDQLVVMNNENYNEKWILNPISTGAASGLDSDSTLYRGICEIVERDAFLISYLNKLPSPKIDLLSTENEKIKEILGIFDRYRLELIVLDITTDLNIPAYAAITLDKTNLGPAVSVGLKAGLDAEQAILGAIEESLMTRSWIRDKFIYKDPNYKRKNKISELIDRAHFWFPVSSIKALDFWLKDKVIKKVKIKKMELSANSLDLVINLLKQQSMEIIYVDITDKKLKRYGIKVVKMIIPQLQPLYLDERYPYLGGNRLYQAPVKMGFLKIAKQEDELNKVPHPFL